MSILLVLHIAFWHPTAVQVQKTIVTSIRKHGEIINCKVKLISKKRIKIRGVQKTIIKNIKLEKIGSLKDTITCVLLKVKEKKKLLVQEIDERGKPPYIKLKQLFIVRMYSWH